MNKRWRNVRLGEVARDLTASRTFNVQPDDVIADPTIRCATHTIATSAISRGFQVRVNKRVRIEPGDLVFSRLHTQNGAFAYSDATFHATTTFVPLHVDEEKVDRRFLFWALHKFLPMLTASDTVGRETYRTSDILALPIPLPPLPEQRRVVARVEALARRVADARTLHGQISSETDALWAATATNKLSLNCPLVRLDSLCTLITDGTHQTPRYMDGGHVFLSAQNVKPFRFMPEQHRRVSDEDYRSCIGRVRPQIGDVLLTRVGAGIGEAALIDRDIDFAFYVSLALLRPTKELVLPEYLVHWLNSPMGRADSRQQTLGKGHSQGNLNLNLLRGFQVPLAPIDEQRRVVAELDQVRMKVASAQQLQGEIGDELESLLPALLDRAFDGMLQ